MEERIKIPRESCLTRPSVAVQIPHEEPLTGTIHEALRAKPKWPQGDRDVGKMQALQKKAEGTFSAAV